MSEIRPLTFGPVPVSRISFLLFSGGWNMPVPIQAVIFSIRRVVLSITGGFGVLTSNRWHLVSMAWPSPCHTWMGLDCSGCHSFTCNGNTDGVGKLEGRRVCMICAGAGYFQVTTARPCLAVGGEASWIEPSSTPATKWPNPSLAS
jgi:hypothetical protein